MIFRYFISLILLLQLLFLHCSFFINRTQKENFFIVAVDRGENDPARDEFVYYKIYINQEWVAKTEGALFFQKKKISLRLPAGKYLFFAERWELESKLDESGNEIKEYKRANNIWQMSAPVYIIIDELHEKYEANMGYDHNSRSFYFEPVKEDR